MGTHPIFESDFDCLTDDGMNIILLVAISLTFGSDEKESSLGGHDDIIDQSDRRNENNLDQNENLDSDLEIQSNQQQQQQQQQNEIKFDDQEVKNDDHIIPPEVDIKTFGEDIEDQRKIISEAANNNGLQNNSQNELLIRDNNQPKRGTSVKNSADAGCGAKIDKSPSDLVNAKYVLNSNKDLYTRIDCQSKFVFNIELCEMIQLDKIEIASFELFSSYPKEFQISAADAEKTKWHTIGTFEAKSLAATKSQIYEVDDYWRSADYMFKFIKFEMISYQ